MGTVIHTCACGYSHPNQWNRSYRNEQLLWISTGSSFARIPANWGAVWWSPHLPWPVPARPRKAPQASYSKFQPLLWFCSVLLLFSWYLLILLSCVFLYDAVAESFNSRWSSLQFFFAGRMAFRYPQELPSICRTGSRREHVLPDRAYVRDSPTRSICSTLPALTYIPPAVRLP